MPLRLVRRPKSPNWIIRGTLRGIRVEESTGTDNKKVAQEIRAKREAEILAQSVYGRRATATFAEAALSYLENGGNKRFLDKVIRAFWHHAARQDRSGRDRQGRAQGLPERKQTRRVIANSTRRHQQSSNMPPSAAGAHRSSWSARRSRQDACAGSHLRKRNV